MDPRNLHRWVLAALPVLIVVLTATAAAQVSPTAFTYQGELQDTGVGVNAADARFSFRLWDAETAGHQIGSDCVAYPVAITGGIFTALVDFGAEAFDGQVRWLEIGVDPTGGTGTTWMAPRQPLTAAPTALHALHGGDNPWTITGNDITYTGGKVGVGVAAPTSKLHVEAYSTEPVIKGVSLAHGTDYGYGVEGQVDGTRGNGVRGVASSTTGTAVGVNGSASSPTGTAVRGHNDATSGNAIGIYGRSDSPTGYAGYFLGRGYFDGWVGIGELSPTSALDVNGIVAMDGFQLNSTTQAGFVLTSNANGRGSWEPAPATGGYWQPGQGLIYYDDGLVGIGTGTPQYQLDVRGEGADAVVVVSALDDGGGVGEGVSAYLFAPVGNAVSGAALATSGQNAGVHGTSASPSGYGVRGHNSAIPGGGAGVSGSANGEQSPALLGLHLATTGYGKAIFGRSDSPDGFGGYFMGKGYFSGNVGIGLTSATEKLDVDGTVRMTGFKLAATPQNGYVLTSDASGTGTWQPAGSGLWSPGTGGKIYYNGGNVGIGISNPNSALSVSGQVESNTIYTNAIDANSLKLRDTPTVGHVLTCVDAQGNADWQAPATGQWSTGASGVIYYNGGNVGIGTAYPSAKFDVVGAVEASGLKITTAPQDGYVLTSDASGNATWQPAAGGLTLPYDGTTSSTTSAFMVTNTGTGMSSHAIHGRLEGTGSGDAAAGRFDASHGHAIVATSSGGSTIYADNSGVGSAVWARADDASTAAGDFGSYGSGSHGLKGSATGEAGHGVYATASGGGAALMAEATGNSAVGLVAKGSGTAGKFYGNVVIYDYTTQDPVLELGKGLDYAEGFDITANDEAEVAPGTVLVIDPHDPGRLACSRQAYDRRVAGIAAGADGLGSGVRLGGGTFDQDVALAGRVYCNVIAVDEEIEPGDLLTTADVPGHAMEVHDHVRAQGAILGKAMGRMAKGERGRILVLVTLQ